MAEGTQFLSTTVAGILDTQISPSSIFEEDWSSEVLLLDTTEFPFTAFSRNIKKQEATELKFNWGKDKFRRIRDQINLAAGYAAGSVSVVVDNGGAWEAGAQMVLERTGQLVCYVTAVTTNTLTTSATTVRLENNDWVRIIAPAHQDGSTISEIKTTTIETPYNYCELTRTALGETEGMTNSKKRMGITIDKQRAKSLMEHQIDKEQKNLFGTRYYDNSTIFTTDTHARYYTGGLIPNIETHIVDIGGKLLTNTAWMDFMEESFDTGSSEKMLLASGALMKVLYGFGWAKTEAPPLNETWGVRCTRWVFGSYALNVVRHKLLTGNYYGYFGIVVDPTNIAERIFAGYDTRLKKAILANNELATKEEFISWHGLQWGIEENHAYIFNFAG